MLHLLLATPALRSPVVRHHSLYANGSFAVDTTVEVPRFEPGVEALEHLKREGYVVVRGIANASELDEARRLLWSFLEGAGVGVRREEPSTWHRSKPNPYGIVWGFGVGHSRFMWYIRTRPRLLKMFELIWSTDDLLASFEGFSMMPPPAQESSWQMAESWFHTDQNAKSRPGRQTVQSFTSLWDQDEGTGAFVVVPRSHKRHMEVTRRVYEARPRTDDEQQFLMIPADDIVLRSPRKPHLVRCKAGDAVLWDSRTVHCNTPRLIQAIPWVSPARAEALEEPTPRPSRLVAYASFAPRKRASDVVIRKRQHGLREQQTCTHWPFDYTCIPTPASRGEVASDPLLLAQPLHKHLIGYTDAQIDAWYHGRPPSGNTHADSGFDHPLPLDLQRSEHELQQILKADQASMDASRRTDSIRS
ncbi:hypothetical protein AB1Y20_009398 [Prymnesium parvum]|uniref:Phytanoyl-CoA dioxygenase n=1 Tax=Prymnesium parvum TaxID=97485 RepID=A0AB34K084_PRYPA